MEPEQKPEKEKAEELPPLEKGRELTREESVERMYARFDRTFEALAK